MPAEKRDNGSYDIFDANQRSSVLLTGSCVADTYKYT